MSLSKSYITLSDELLSQLSKILKHFGAGHQKTKCVEELGELVSALAREIDGRSTHQEVITELADVLVTALQLSVNYGLEEVVLEVKRKIDRTLVKYNIKVD